jgi:hypothetical protein
MTLIVIANKITFGNKKHFLLHPLLTQCNVFASHRDLHSSLGKREKKRLQKPDKLSSLAFAQHHHNILKHRYIAKAERQTSFIILMNDSAYCWDFSTLIETAIAKCSLQSHSNNN